MRLSQSSFSRGIWFACAAVASATMVLTSLQQAFTWCARPHASVVGPVPDARGRERGTSRRRERADIPRENIRSRRLSHNVRQRARVVNSCECCSSLLSQPTNNNNSSAGPHGCRRPSSVLGPQLLPAGQAQVSHLQEAGPARCSVLLAGLLQGELARPQAAPSRYV